MILSSQGEIRYDRLEGCVSEYLDGHIRSQIMVRQNLMDRLIREACIAELERLGYTVTAPEVAS